MVLYKQLLAHILSKEEVRVVFPQLKVDSTKMIHSTAYEALSQIREILRDETLSDEDCFEKMEKIIAVYEMIGSDCGTRHD